MVFFNYALRKLNAKIVYYGPGLCGKTTNLQWIHDHFEGGQRGKMISLATEGDRTIFFDLLPIDIGSIRGMDVTLQLYTVPGQVHYNSTRQLVLRGADGVVFVADSQRTMKSSNVESYENLQENLMLQGIELKDFPHALQFNKRDLRDLLSTEDLNESLNVLSVPIFEAIATEGIGVQETLEGIVKLVMRNLREKYEPVASASGPKAPTPMQVTGPTAFQPPAPVSEPLAPDFAAMEEPSAPALQTNDGVPSFVAPAEDETTAFDPVSISTPAADADSSFAPFQDEDGIETAVYEDQEAETAEREPEIESPDFGDKSPVFAPEGDTDASVPETEEPNEADVLFTEPRDEDGADGFEPAMKPDETPDEVPVEPEATEIATPEPEIVAESLRPPVSDESMEDLFETEVPTVKDFVRKAMGGFEATVESTHEVADDDAPPSVDPPDVVVAPSANDRFEDRIEAPGPFAPAPVADEPSDSEDTAEADEEAVRAEVRQALGASEDREALASLSVEEDREPDQPDEVRDEPVEAEPVDSSFLEEPPEVESDDEEVVLESFTAEEPVTGPEFVDSPDEVTESEAPSFTEPEVEEVAIDVVVEEEPEVEEPVDEPVYEPEVEEPIDEPEVEEPIAPPPPVPVDPLGKSQPIIFGSGDPFADDDVEAVIPEVLPEAAHVVPVSNAIDVTAADNQLHLALKGSGAIAEMGQVRALDLEVPVPGQWVGNRKVTLQLRLTLTPAEDEDG